VRVLQVRCKERERALESCQNKVRSVVWRRGHCSAQIMLQTDAVVEAIGNFGPWQAQSLFLLALVKIPAGWHMLSILFLAPQPETFGGQYWCARPDPNLDVQQWIKDRHPKNNVSEKCKLAFKIKPVSFDRNT
jgi:hypothetical protein